jgi:hypothetical protein
LSFNPLPSSNEGKIRSLPRKFDDSSELHPSPRSISLLKKSPIRTRAPGRARESPTSLRPRNQLAKNRWTSRKKTCKSSRPDQHQDDQMSCQQQSYIAARHKPPSKHRPHVFPHHIEQKVIPSSSSTTTDGLGLVRRSPPEGQLMNDLRSSTVVPQVSWSQFPHGLELRPAPLMASPKSAGVLRGRFHTAGFTTRQTDDHIGSDVHSHLKSGLNQRMSRFTPDSSDSSHSTGTQRCGNVPVAKKLRQTQKTDEFPPADYR